MPNSSASTRCLLNSWHRLLAVPAWQDGSLENPLHAARLKMRRRIPFVPTAPELGAQEGESPARRLVAFPYTPLLNWKNRNHTTTGWAMETEKSGLRANAGFFSVSALAPAAVVGQRTSSSPAPDGMPVPYCDRFAPHRAGLSGTPLPAGKRST